jgi:hypothetical protein
MNRSLSAAALIGAATLAACASKDAAKTDTAKVAQTGAASTASGAYDPATRTATVHAKDFAYGAPDSVPAGWTTFHLVNDGPQLHHMQIARLDSGKTAADLAAALKPNAPLPGWLVLVGGPNAPNPGSESNATLNLTAGNYVMMCFVDTPDHVPHVAKGMLRPLVVTASTAAGAEPAADATIELSDYTFAVTGTLTSGHHTIKVTNKAAQGHEVEIIKYAPGKTVKDLIAWGEKFEGPPPGDAVGGVAGLASNTSGTFSVDLTPGNYGFICFYPDAKDGKPHLLHGMSKDFTVK